MRKVLCPYCGGQAYPIKGVELYPDMPTVAENVFWKCSPCYAWVGCHQNSDEPMGGLANRELRLARRDAHYWFDRIWKTGRLGRTAAYKWLAYEMGMHRNDCHIGKFDVGQCREVIKICRRREDQEYEANN